MMLKVLNNKGHIKFKAPVNIYTIVLLIIGLNSFGQSFSDDVTQIHEIPTTPTMWEFEKYGNYPVSMHTGVPDISIPLVFAQSGELKIPVSLRYHASGIKVDQKATWVGLGWTLMAGGAITRTVRGGVDEWSQGYINNTYYEQGQFDPAFEDNYSITEQMILGLIDTEPDIFNYNFMGYSGKFIFDHSENRGTATISLIPHNDLIITPTFSGGGGNESIESFTITTPEGYVAEFDYPERSSEYRQGIQQSLTVTANSVWHLKEVTAPNGVDKISFEYKTLPGTVFNERYSRTESVELNDRCNNISDNIITGSNGGGTFSQVKRLERINFNNGYIYLNSSTGNRQDDPDDESLRLDDVQLYSFINGKSTLIKKFQFQYGYFGSINNQDSTPDEYEVRLKLEQLIEEGGNGATKNPYEFSYIENMGIPARFSTAQDYWGYFNGNNSATLIPYYSYAGLTFGSADREPAPWLSKMGILERIVYPTKGYTEFEFEGNQVPVAYGSTEERDVGGLRIKTIKNFDFDTTLQWQKSYEYVRKENNAISSGVYNDAGLMDESSFYKVMDKHVSTKQCGSCQPTFDYQNCETKVFSVSSYPVNGNGSANVFYGNVKEYNGSPTSGEGYTWYTYSSTKDTFYSLSGPGSIFFNIDRSWDRGQLLKEEVYEEGNSSPIKSITYTYEEVEVRSPISGFKPFTKFIVQGYGYYPPGEDPSIFRSAHYYLGYYTEPIVWKRLASKITEERGVSVEQNFYYDLELDHANLAREETTDSKGNSIEVKMYYPDDVDGTSSMEGGALSTPQDTVINLLKKNAIHSRVGQVIQTVKTFNGEKSIERTYFGLWNTSMVLPDSIQTSKKNSPLESRYVFHEYDSEGNVLEVSKTNGSHVYYIWGYDKQYPIAKIENLKSDEIDSNLQSLINASIAASDIDDSTIDEANLREALDDVRANLPSAMITTYTYDPLKGVTSITDPKGQTIYYLYDEFNRLKEVRDTNNHIVTDYQYRYKN